MRISGTFTSLALAAGMTLVLSATAEANSGGAPLYAFPSKENYCPTGLQPVIMGGVICCGTPNRSESYHSMMSHPVQHKRAHHRVRHHRTADCPIGQKGCN